ncbi:hypothetical protein GCM10020000_69090 [Streptomyces olivoverticillatus]
MKGRALSRKAATARCAQVRARRGSRCRLTARVTASTAVPKSIRPKEMYGGAKPSVPSFMNRKLKPQMRVRAPNRIRQSTAGRPCSGAAAAGAGVTGVVEGVDAAEELDGGVGVATVLMNTTMPGRKR